MKALFFDALEPADDVFCNFAASYNGFLLFQVLTNK